MRTRLAILGNGASGRAAARLAAKLGCETVTFDGDDEFPAHFTEMRPRETEPSAAPFDGAIVSPGIPLDHPWQVACRAAGIPLKSELQFGCEELRRQGWKLLAVTGSKGKSSVVKLIADALNLAGHRAVACGNYGLPVCEVACDPSPSPSPSPSSFAVVEVSSFMMETTELPADTFEAAAILNLQEDHLDRHGSVAVYHALKRKLLTMAKKGLLPESCCRGLVVSSATTETTSPQQQGWGDLLAGSYINLLAGSYFDNEILRPNGAAAIFLLRAAGLDDATIARAFASFEPLPHRMNTVGVFGGVRCIDDSKATSLAALAAGVRMAGSCAAGGRISAKCAKEKASGSLPAVHFAEMHPQERTAIRLIAGGLPKGDDPKSVVGDLTARVKKVYLIGQSAEQFASAWSEAVDCEICGTMERAVRLAMREAESGETILLSPGTASFDQFKSFGERGDVFADLVKKEGTNK